MAAKEADTKEALSIAEELIPSRKSKRNAMRIFPSTGRSWSGSKPGERSTLGRLRFWPKRGITLSLHEMSPSAYDKLGDTVRRIVLERTKNVVRFLLLSDETINEEDRAALEGSRFKLPSVSTGEIRKKLEDAEKRLKSIKEELASLAAYGASLERAIEALKKEVQFETYASGMGEEDLSKTLPKGLRWLISSVSFRRRT